MAKIHDIRSQTKRSNGTRPLSRITHIARHHSATTSGDFFSFWRHWNGTNGWGTGGYHEIILRDGSVQLCYDPEEITNGVANHNSYVYHICVVGNGSFTAAQEATFKERCLYNMKRLNIPVERVLGHREFRGASTTCPGIDMNKVRASLRDGNVVKPAAPSQVNLDENIMGVVTIMTDSLNVRKDASFNAPVVKTVKAGDSFRVYAEKDGLYNVGGNQWTSAGKAYVVFTPNKNYEKPEEPEVILEEEDEKLELSTRQRQEIAATFKKARERGVFSSEAHEKAILDGTMTQSQLLYLNNLVAGAALVGGKRINADK